MQSTVNPFLKEKKPLVLHAYHRVWGQVLYIQDSDLFNASEGGHSMFSSHVCVDCEMPRGIGH